MEISNDMARKIKTDKLICKSCKNFRWIRHNGFRLCEFCNSKRLSEKRADKAMRQKKAESLLETNYGNERDKKGVKKKIKKKKVVPKQKRMKRLRKACDDLWSEAVKIRDGHKCQYCGTNKTLNSHHIYSRSRKSVRWDIDNGITLCVSHHTFNQAFSAHKTPTEFTDWYRDKVGEEKYQELKRKANIIVKWDEAMLEEKKQELLKYKI